MTIGTGFFGRSSVAENVGPQHLLQWVKMAWNKDDRIQMPSFAATRSSEKPRIGVRSEGEIDYDFGNHPPGAASPSVARPDDIRAEIRRIILEELKELTRR